MSAQNTNLKKSRLQRSVAWLIGGLCVACCAIPILAISIGSTGLIISAAFFESIAIAVLVLGLMILLVYWRFVRKSAASCDIHCPSRPDNIE